MGDISLSVTKKVLEYAKPPREKERQIAYTSASADIATHLAEVTRDRPVTVRLAGRIMLVVADRGAIWRAHNEQYNEDSDALFTFLARYPSQPLRFVCEVVK